MLGYEKIILLQYLFFFTSTFDKELVFYLFSICLQTEPCLLPNASVKPLNLFMGI
jgi:hypothetical protein